MFEGDRRGKLSFLPNRCVCIAYSCGYLGEYCQILLRFEIGKRLKSKCRGRCPYQQETNSSSTYKKPGCPRLLIPRGGRQISSIHPGSDLMTMDLQADSKTASALARTISSAAASVFSHFSFG